MVPLEQLFAKDTFDEKTDSGVEKTHYFDFFDEVQSDISDTEDYKPLLEKIVPDFTEDDKKIKKCFDSSTFCGAPLKEAYPGITELTKDLNKFLQVAKNLIEYRGMEMCEYIDQRIDVEHQDEKFRAFVRSMLLLMSREYQNYMVEKKRHRGNL